MTDITVLFTSLTPDGPTRWAQLRDGVVVASEASDNFFEAASSVTVPKDSSLMVVLPGELAMLRRLETPARRASDVERAARFALDDWMSESGQNTHLIVTPTSLARTHAVCAVPPDWLAVWKAAIEQAGLYPDSVTLDVLASIHQFETATIIAEHDRCLFTQEGAGFVLPCDIAIEVLPELLAEIDAANIQLYVTPAHKQGFEALTNKPAQILEDKLSLVSLLTNPNAPSLYKVSSGQNFTFDKIRKYWKLSGVLAASCLLAWLGLMVAETMQLQRQADTMMTATQSAYQSAFPEEAITNLRTQARNRIGGEQTAAFTDLLAKSFSAMENVETVVVTNLVYGADGRIAFDVSFPDFNDLEALKDALSAKGLRSEEGLNPRRDGASFIGRLYVEAAQ